MHYSVKVMDDLCHPHDCDGSSQTHKVLSFVGTWCMGHRELGRAFMVPRTHRLTCSVPAPTVESRPLCPSACHALVDKSILHTEHPRSLQLPADSASQRHVFLLLRQSVFGEDATFSISTAILGRCIHRQHRHAGASARSRDQVRRTVEGICRGSLV